MNALKSLLGSAWQRVLEEPVYTQALVVAGVALGSAFGLKWDGPQVAAVTGFSAAFLAWLTRKAVTPVAAPVIPEGTTVTVTTPAGEPDRVVTA